MAIKAFNQILRNPRHAVFSASRVSDDWKLTFLDSKVNLFYKGVFINTKKQQEKNRYYGNKYGSFYYIIFNWFINSLDEYDYFLSI